MYSVPSFFVLKWQLTSRIWHDCLGSWPPHLHLTTSKVMVIVWRLRGNIIRTVLYIANVLPLQLTKTVHTARLGLEFDFLCFLGCMICIYVGVCFVLPWTVESFPFMFWHWHNKLKWAPIKLFALSPLLRIRSWFRPDRGHCEQKGNARRGGYLCRWSSTTE